MPSHYTRRLVQLPIQALAVLFASVATAAAVWHGGLTVLTWLGVANPARGDTGTILGLGAVTIGSSIVPGWLTARDYFVGEGEPLGPERESGHDANEQFGPDDGLGAGDSVSPSDE